MKDEINTKEVLNRISEAINFLKLTSIYISNEKLAEAMKYNKSNFSSALNGNERYLTMSFITKFSEKFKISYTWLLTGKGEMLKSENSTIIQGKNKNNIVNSTVSSEQDTSELVNMIKILENQLKTKDEQISKLIDKLSNQ